MHWRRSQSREDKIEEGKEKDNWKDLLTEQIWESEEKVEIKRIGEEWDASFQGILGSLASQTNSDPSFVLGQEGQIWGQI